MTNKLPGKFIALDGPDGCGKSTQARALAERLEKAGTQAATFRDPGATAIGEKIRTILLNPEHVAMSVRAELLLYMAARAQLWEEKISPALSKGRCVVLDRWVSSTCAYQGYAGGFGIDKVVRIGEQSLERVWPDLTIILDVDLETAAKRLDRNLDRMEQKGREYHKKVRQGFLELAKHYSNIVVVDGARDIERVHEKVVEAVSEHG